jgi:hypothetical protein
MGNGSSVQKPDQFHKVGVDLDEARRRVEAIIGRGNRVVRGDLRLTPRSNKGNRAGRGRGAPTGPSVRRHRASIVGPHTRGQWNRGRRSQELQHQLTPGAPTGNADDRASSPHSFTCEAPCRSCHNGAHRQRNWQSAAKEG